MALTERLTEAGRQIRDAFSLHAGLIEKLRALKAKHAAEGAVRTKAIAAAQAEVDRLDEPRRRLERLRAEEFGAGLAADRDIGVIENELRDPTGWPRALRLLARDVARFREMLDQPVEIREEHNRVTGARRIVNLKDLEQRQAAAALWVRVNTELRDTLWRLDPSALRARIGEIRQELAPFDQDNLMAATEGEEAEAAREG